MAPKIMTNKGFTLIEVMVAMAIAGITLVTAGAIATGFIKNVAHLEEKTAADIAAKNLMDRFLMPWDIKKKYRPNTLESGEVSQGGYHFSYTQTLQKTPTKGLREVTLSLYSKGKETPLRTLKMFADTQ